MITIRIKINLEPPTEPGRFLGCYKQACNASAGDFELLLKHRPEQYPRDQEQTAKREAAKPQPLSSATCKALTPVRGYFYDMEEYFQKNVDRDMRGTGARSEQLKSVPTPFLDENVDPLGCIGI